MRSSVASDLYIPFNLVAYFEDALKKHDKVLTFSKVNDVLFKITLTEGLSAINIIYIENGTVTQSIVNHLKKKFPSLDCVVTDDWNGYTRQAKEYGFELNIGVFIMSKILVALSLVDYITYH